MRTNPIDRFRRLLEELLFAVDVHKRTRPKREARLADEQWNMLNQRFGATFGPGAEFPLSRLKVAVATDKQPVPIEVVLQPFARLLVHLAETPPDQGKIPE